MTSEYTSVLLLCSDSETGNVLRETIGEMDFELSVCSSKEDALNTLREKKRDIIVTEYSLGDSTGLDFLQTVYEMCPGCTRIIVGEKGNEELIVKAVIKGTANTYIEAASNSGLIKGKLENISRIQKTMANIRFVDGMPGANEFPIDMTVYEKLMEAINEDRPLPHIAGLIARDVALTAKVLQVANSAFYGNFSGTSIEKAIIYMGLNPVKDIVLLHSLAANLKMNSAQNKALEEIVKHSIETNYYFHAVAKKVHCPITPLNNSIGIIHDIGKLVQLVFFPIEHSGIEEFRKENPNTDYYTCEMDTGNKNIIHTDIGAYFLQSNNFNQYSIEAALFHHEPELASEDMKPCIEALFLANTLADIRDGFDLSLEEAVKRCTRIELEPSDILTILPPM